MEEGLKEIGVRYWIPVREHEVKLSDIESVARIFSRALYDSYSLDLRFITVADRDNTRCLEVKFTSTSSELSEFGTFADDLSIELLGILSKIKNFLTMVELLPVEEEEQEEPEESE